MKTKLVLLCLSATTLGVVSCEKEVIQSKEAVKNSKFKNSLKSTSDTTSNDTLNLYRILPHGNKGNGRLGDD